MPLEQRIVDALDEVRPYLESHGGNVELLAVEEATVRLRLQGSCSGCPSSTMTLKLAIEKAIQKAAPEVEEVIAEGGSPLASPALLQIEEAKSVCRRCEVTETCLQWAIESGQDAGVWGGMSEDERRALKRRPAPGRAICRDSRG